MRRIAVVEDNPDNRLLAVALLEGRYHCDEYETGFAALDGMVASLPDLVLLDISLPGIDGVETLKRLRADARLARLPVIAVTAHAMAGDRERFLAEGFDDYLTKPILDEQALLGAIARGLTKASSPTG
ncbi:MAG: response regulator [Gemmatimonadetes bacterium]|nr:response regulator [Gemmatimonadota bacterium]